MSEPKTEGRKWWPQEVCDEVMPPGLDSPDQFIVAGDTYTWRLDYPAGMPGVDDGERGLFRQPLKDGDIVKFVCCDDLGSVELTIRPDRTFDVAGVVPAYATHFWFAGDVGSLGGDLDELIAIYFETWGAGMDEPAVEFARMAWWSDGRPYKFTLTADGPRFIAVSQAEARQ
jgi:hypothetical protein